MSGNEIETFQKISDFIDSFDSTSLGSIIILAILVCVVLVSVFKSIYSTSVEELFMNSKEKNKNMFFQLLVILTILIFINFICKVSKSISTISFFSHNAPYTIFPFLHVELIQLSSLSL